MHVNDLIACHECDLLHQRRPLPTRGVATCTRCGAALYRNRPNSLERTLALSVGGLILYMIANLYPLLTMSIEGRSQEATLLSGVVEIYRQGMPLVAILVMITGILFPLMQIVGLIYILLPLKYNHCPWGMAVVFRAVRSLQPWAMVEVFVLGILIAIVKLAGMATVLPGTALYAFLALMFAMAGVTVSLNPDIVWKRLNMEPAS